MAKARKMGSSRRRATTKKRRTMSRVRKVELSPVRRAVERKIAQLKRLEQTPRVREALKRMKRCKAEVAAMCGTHMLFPI